MKLIQHVLVTVIALWPAANAVFAQTAYPIEHQGVTREVIVVNAPAAGTSDAARPVIIALHGRRDPAEAHRSFPPLDALAKAEGFVAVYPAAMQGSWNYAGRAASLLSRAGSEIADDAGFLAKLIDKLIADKLADPARIYVSGASSGGFMTYTLACAFADKLAAAAPMLAGMTEAQISACKPARIVPMLVIAGTDDRVVPYDGLLAADYRVTSIPETLEFWRRQQGCTGQKAAPMPHRVQADPTRTLIVEWSGCRVEGGLKLYRVEGGGHVLPALAPLSADMERRWGRRSQDFDTGTELWSYFRRFKR